MAALQNRHHVPKFGNWEADNNTRFTFVFDNARKGRTDGRMIDPNDPENPNAKRRLITEPEKHVGTGRNTARSADERRYSKEDAKVDNLRRRASDESAQQQQAGHVSNSGGPSAGSFHSNQSSPMHPQHQPELGGRGSGSPALKGKNSYDSCHGTPGRSEGGPASRGDKSLQNRPHVPNFGNWEAANNTPFTFIFDNARKGSTDERMINANDPQENPNMFAKRRLITEPEKHVGTGRNTARSAHERQYSKTDGKVDNLGRRASDESPQQQNSGRTARPSAGSYHRFERSPMHPQHQPKLGGKGSGSPALEGKNSYYRGHVTPGRSEGRPASRGNESPIRGVVLQGEWNASFPPGRNPHLMKDRAKVSCSWWCWK